MVNLNPKFLLGALPTILLIIIGLSLNPSYASTITVDNEGDDGTGCTFREAIESFDSLTLEPGCALVGSEGFGTNDVVAFANTIQEPILLTNGSVRMGSNANITINGAGITIRPDTNSNQPALSISRGSVVINGLTIENGSTGSGGAIVATNSSTVTLNFVTLSNNTASSSGGAIYAVSSTINLFDSLIDGNSADNGGGIYLDSGQLNLQRTTVSNNTASFLDGMFLRGDGGGIFSAGATLIEQSTISGNVARGLGGGINIDSESLVMTDSTISGNTVDSSGGGLSLVNSPNNSKTVTLTNNTFSGNTATFNTGGGVYVIRHDITITNNTFTDNFALGLRGAGIFAATDTTINLINTIIANSRGANFQNGCATDSGVVVNVGNDSIIEGRTCFAPRGGDPGLLSLANNGGPTKTHGLRQNSIARGTASLSECPANDQRGQLRDDDDGACDVGAIEFNSNDDINLIVIPLGDNGAVITPL